VDPVSPNFFAGLAVEMIKRLANHQTGSRDNQGFRLRQDLINKRVLKRSGFTTVKLLNKLSGQVPESDQLGLSRALSAPEGEQLVRAVAVACLTDSFLQRREELEENLTAILVLVSDMRPETAEMCAGIAVGVLAESNVEVIEQLNSSDPRQLRAASDRAETEQQSGYLFAIAKRTRMLRRHSPDDLREFLDFAERYRLQVNRATKHLVPAYFDTQKRVDIRRLHVAPEFDSQDGFVSFDNLLRRELPRYDRVVVLGDPGAGKSTFAQRVVHEHSRGRLGDGYTRVPFVVTIREYEKRNGGNGRSIIKYLTEWISDEYHIDSPPGAVEYFLATGRAFVVFDGLDELQEVDRRRDTVNAIELFAAQYPTTPILVTSRLVGYREAPLHRQTFQEMYLQRFSFHDIETYVHRWFALDETLSERDKQTVADGFLRESYSIDDIRANPMMLSLLCNVYRGARSIPQNRAELYGRCAQMLFEKWDAHRGIDHQGILKADARGALQDIALWTFRSHHDTDRILERDLRRRLVDYWMANRIEDRLRAEDEADRLMESWRGRAWVLTDVGIVDSPSGQQRAYQFTHQTFLEYFAAVELVRRHPSPAKLWEVLRPHLQKNEWDIVAQVSIQLLEDFYRGGKDGLVDRLLTKVTRSDLPLEPRINLLEFAVRNLDTLAPGPRVQRNAARVAVDLATAAQPDFSDATEFDDGSPDLEPADLDDRSRAAAVDVLLAGLLAPGDSGMYFRDEAAHRFETLIGSADDGQAAKAFVVSANLDLVGLAAGGAQGLAKTVVNVVQRDGLVRRKWRAWADVTYFAATTALRHGLISHEDFAEAAPTAAVLLDEPPLAWNSDLIPSPSAGLHWLRRYLRLTDADSEFSSPVNYGTQARDLMRNLGLRLIAGRPPHFGFEWFHGYQLLRSLVRHTPVGEANDPLLLGSPRFTRDPAEIYGASVLFCAFIEDFGDPDDLDHFDPFASMELGPLEPLRSVFRARFAPAMGSEAQEVLSESPLAAVAKKRLAAWSRSQLDFAD
jgi:hypothetical protein